MATVTYRGHKDGTASDALEIEGVLLRKGEPTSVSDEVLAALDRPENAAAYKFDVGEQAELKGQALEDRIKELGIEGTSDMTADEKRAAVAQAEGDA